MLAFFSQTHFFLWRWYFFFQSDSLFHLMLTKTIPSMKWFFFGFRLCPMECYQCFDLLPVGKPTYFILMIFWLVSNSGFWSVRRNFNFCKFFFVCLLIFPSHWIFPNFKLKLLLTFFFQHSHLNEYIQHAGIFSVRLIFSFDAGIFFSQTPVYIW